MDVTMPDGAVITGVPDGTTRAQLAAKYSAHVQAQDAPSGADQRSKGVMSNGMLPGHAGNLDRTKAGDNWATFELSEEGIPKHYVLPTQPNDRPSDDATGFMGDAVERFQKTKQHYGAFDTDEAGAAFMKTPAPDDAAPGLWKPVERKGVITDKIFGAKSVDDAIGAAWHATQPMGGDFVAKPAEQSLTSGSSPALNPDREAGFLERAGASIKTTPEGRKTYYEKLGYHVATDADGKVYLLDRRKNEWFPEDSDDVNLKDFTSDFVGDAIQQGSELAIARRGAGKPSAAAKGAGVGALVRQTASDILPGSDNLGLTERVENVAANAALGGATQLGANALLKGIEKVSPRNIAAKYVNKQYQTPFAQESDNLANQIGQTYTPGQATGSRGLLTIEGLVRRHPASADKMAEFDAKQLDISLTNLNKVVDSISSAKAGPEAVGQRVSDAFDRVLNQATAARRKTAEFDFSEVDRLAGRYRVIKPNSLNSEIDDLTKEFDVPGGGDASSQLVGQLQRIKKDIAERAGPEGLNAQETQRLLEVYGKASRGSGEIFKDLDTAQQRMIARRLQDAVLRDVDAAADGGGHVGQIATALKTARDNYKTNSQAINQMEESVLGRLFGGRYEKAPERVAQAMLNMKPTELKESFAILSKSDPQIAQAVKRQFVEKSLVDGGIPASANAPMPQAAGEPVFSAQKFLTSVRKSPVWDIMNDKERVGMMTAVRDLERVSYRAGTDGSPTAPLLFAWEVGKAVVTGGAMSPSRVGKTVAAVVVPSRLAKLIINPAGQTALRTLRTTQPGSKAYLGASAYAAAVMAGDYGQEAEVSRDPSLDEALGTNQQ